MEFGDFCNALGLTEYPFNVFTTENEQEYVNKLFIEPPDYSKIQSTYNAKRTMVISGNRGSGKTALVNRLTRNNCETQSLVCLIEDFSEIKEKSTLEEFYAYISKSIVNTLFTNLGARYHPKLSKDDRVLLSFLYNKFATPITKNILQENLINIQLNWWQKIWNRICSFFSLIGNFNLTVAINSIRSIVHSQYGLPLASNEEIIKYIPSLQYHIDNNYIKPDISYELLKKICDLAYKLEYNQIVIVFDKIDEDGRFKNDAEAVANFMTPLLSDGKILSDNTLQLLISIWSVPFKKLGDTFRSQKHFCQEIKWTDKVLIQMFDQRIDAFNSGIKLSFETFFEKDEDKKNIIKLANESPRDLWHLIDRIIRKQYDIDSSAKKISQNAVKQGIEDFIKKFNYFEYYPKKRNAKSSSVNIYGYINHLLKLNVTEFTKSQFNTKTGAGGSTQNYITNMTSMGLIRATDKKGNRSGVMYIISDPKISYAVKNNIKIENI